MDASSSSSVLLLLLQINRLFSKMSIARLEWLSYLYCIKSERRVKRNDQYFTWFWFMLSSMALRSRTASGTSVSLLWDRSITSRVRMAQSWTGNARRSLCASEMWRSAFRPSTVGGRDVIRLLSTSRVSSRCKEPICGGKLAVATPTQHLPLVLHLRFCKFYMYSEKKQTNNT